MGIVFKKNYDEWCVVRHHTVDMDKTDNLCHGALARSKLARLGIGVKDATADWLEDCWREAMDSN